MNKHISEVHEKAKQEVGNGLNLKKVPLCCNFLMAICQKKCYLAKAVISNYGLLWFKEKHIDVKFIGTKIPVFRCEAKAVTTNL